MLTIKIIKIFESNQTLHYILHIYTYFVGDNKDLFSAIRENVLFFVSSAEI